MYVHYTRYLNKLDVEMFWYDHYCADTNTLMLSYQFEIQIQNHFFTI